MEDWYYYTLFSPLWIEIARNAIFVGQERIAFINHPCVNSISNRQTDFTPNR
ncbi:MAG: hypothetical protein SAK29_02680 [Scytonema sp. PMC 1069.18]|nr:hypothetical protein [Scytonema sp. PMC 1069.18]MEC4882779.1 hypothetical protein [Scytonema sp. PMC 1070.18]